MSAIPRRLEGKRVVVTGGSRGLGRAFCEAFAAAGARVAFNYSKDQEAPRRRCGRSRRMGSKAVPCAPRSPRTRSST
jgi:NAD(P)-dependent dehydrogenase (short-subunit alcohol dehydrogenase family)